MVAKLVPVTFKKHNIRPLHCLLNGSLPTNTSHISGDTSQVLKKTQQSVRNPAGFESSLVYAEAGARQNMNANNVKHIYIAKTDESILDGRTIFYGGGQSYVCNFMDAVIRIKINSIKASVMCCFWNVLTVREVENKI